MPLHRPVHSHMNNRQRLQNTIQFFGERVSVMREKRPQYWSESDTKYSMDEIKLVFMRLAKELDVSVFFDDKHWEPQKDVSQVILIYTLFQGLYTTSLVPLTQISCIIIKALPFIDKVIANFSFYIDATEIDNKEALHKFNESARRHQQMLSLRQGVSPKLVRKITLNTISMPKEIETYMYLPGPMAQYLVTRHAQLMVESNQNKTAIAS